MWEDVTQRDREPTGDLRENTDLQSMNGTKLFRRAVSVGMLSMSRCGGGTGDTCEAIHTQRDTNITTLFRTEYYTKGVGIHESMEREGS